MPIRDPELDPWRLHAVLIGEIPRLRRYATAWLGDAAAADALVQEGIEWVIAAAAEPDEPHQLRVRLLGVLHDLREGRADSARSDGAAGLRSLTLHLHSHAAHRERTQMQELLGAIGRLSDEHRQALLLIALEGLSYRDAADVLGVPLGTVMSHLTGAREKLLMQTGGADAGNLEGPSRSDNGGATAPSPVSELDLHAYLDGELGADRVQAVEAFLQSRPGQVERLQAFAEQDEMIRKLYAPLLSRPVPAELLAPLLAVPAPGARLREQVTIAAAVVLLLLGFVAGWLVCTFLATAGVAFPWLSP